MIFYENTRLRYGTTFLLRRHFVKDKSTGITLYPTSDHLTRLGEILAAAQHVPWGGTSQRDAEARIYFAFCMAVHGVDAVQQVFMTQEPTIAAVTFGTMGDVY